MNGFVRPKLHGAVTLREKRVIAPDADLETAVEAVAYAALINAGQVCTSTERVYVPQEMGQAFAGAMADYARSLRLGPGLAPTTDMGPMAAPAYRQKWPTTWPTR